MLIVIMKIIIYKRLFKIINYLKYDIILELL